MGTQYSHEEIPQDLISSMVVPFPKMHDIHKCFLLNKECHHFIKQYLNDSDAMYLRLQNIESYLHWSHETENSNSQYHEYHEDCEIVNRYIYTTKFLLKKHTEPFE